MRVKEAAERLEVSQSLIYALVAAGRLRHYRIGRGRGAIRIPDGAIEEFLKAAEVTINPVPPKKAFKHIVIPRA